MAVLFPKTRLLSRRSNVGGRSTPFTRRSDAGDNHPGKRERR
jgi:hypothetical protein